jgi:excisionase family DNA binding protein
MSADSGDGADNVADTQDRGQDHGSPVVLRPALEPKLLLTVEEAARVLSINRSTVYDLLARGELASVSIGRRRLISRQALGNFIDWSERIGRPR